MTSPLGRQPLTDYLQLQTTTDRELFRVLELAARQSSASVRKLDLTAGSNLFDRVRAAQFQLVLTEIVGVQRDLWESESGVGGIILRSFPKAAAAAAKSFGVLEAVLTSTIGRSAAGPILAGAKAAASRGIELDRTRRARTLSTRVYRNRALSSGAVERQIRAGIIQGLSAKELAAHVKKYISPSTPGGVSYAAMRLARTEINNAFHEAQKIQGQAPWIKSVHWNTSGSHPRKDACDELATKNGYRLGAGNYPADELPDKPHPHCLCFTTYNTISETEMLKLLPRGQRAAS
jgi:hypothetical protein